MAVKIAEPNADQANLEDWHKFIARTAAQGGGFICMELSDSSDPQRPEIAAGSRFEMNGAFYSVGPGNEAVSNDPDGNGTARFIYAKVSDGGESCTFEFDTAAPVWSAAKGGWYSEGCDRAVAIFYTDGRRNNKTILDSCNAMFALVKELSLLEHTAAGGTLVKEFNTFTNGESLYLIPGLYSFELKGASGGPCMPAGQQYNILPQNQAAGGFPGESREGVFFWEGGPIIINVGETGGRGGYCKGGMNYAGGGGGGGLSSIGSIVAYGGRPGKGANAPPPASVTATYSYIPIPGFHGYPAHGVFGGAGGHAAFGYGYGSYSSDITATNHGIGLEPDGTTDGYARIYRIW